MGIKSSNVVLKCDFGSEELVVDNEGNFIVFTLETANGTRHSVYINPDEADLFMASITGATTRARAADND